LKHTTDKIFPWLAAFRDRTQWGRPTAWPPRPQMKVSARTDPACSNNLDQKIVSTESQQQRRCQDGAGHSIEARQHFQVGPRGRTTERKTWTGVVMRHLSTSSTCPPLTWRSAPRTRSRQIRRQNVINEATLFGVWWFRRWVADEGSKWRHRASTLSWFHVMMYHASARPAAIFVGCWHDAVELCEALSSTTTWSACEVVSVYNDIVEVCTRTTKRSRYTGVKQIATIW